MDSERVAADTPRRRLVIFVVHVRLGEQIARRGIPPRKFDAGCLADHAASAVAPDEIARPHHPAIGQADVDAVVVLGEGGHLCAAIDAHAEFADPLGQGSFDLVLPQRQPVRVAGGKVADVQPNLGETRHLRHLSLRQESIGDAALIEDFDGAGVQTPGARSDQILVGAPLDDRDVDAGQTQFAGEHQARGATSGDEHRMLDLPARALRNNHVDTPPLPNFGFGQRFCDITPVLRQAPACAIG